MSNFHFHSWGRFPRVEQTVVPLQWRTDALPKSSASFLAQGLGRSYGDVCLNDKGLLLTTPLLDHFISFDTEHGILRAESGVSLAAILAFAVPRGWFLPVTPGTKYVTIGGAIANDVHGKNHHRTGTFGCHVRCFELLRSDGQILLCSATENTELYKATIGGLGLTGLIRWAEIQLMPIASRLMTTEAIQFDNVEEFFQLSAESDKAFEYTMAWVDCVAQGDSLGRGIFYRGNHASASEAEQALRTGKVKLVNEAKKITMPIDFPTITLNRWTVQLHNFYYYNKQMAKKVANIVDYDPFFYPLDAILQWNRLYGKQGFVQYQCVVPYQDHAVIRTILEKIAASGLSSFLAVLKTFGDVPSVGMLSFPRKGVTLALDFPMKGASMFSLLDTLDELVMAAGGAVYPCKDARLSARAFQAYYPQWQEFAKLIDPQFSSSFWRRVTS